MSGEERDPVGCRVLVIEDSVDAADTLRILLEPRGSSDLRGGAWTPDPDPAGS